MHHDGHCGCGHDHSHTHTHDCGCGYEHGPAQGELTPAMEDFLHHLHHHHFLPVARFLVESSVEEDFCAVALAPVYLRAPDESMESVKETAAMLLELEKMGYLTLDYDYPLDRYSYKEYKESELYAYFCRTVAEGTGRAGFLGDRPVLELGSIAPT
ncbi:hypothetical protein INF37_10020 [Pseudoflavonifractor sp. DSM 107456]|uniref:Uncharacterized protein n=1 Tax=Pseudoflavonifractor gallinarum TaxID=2779352 RepID=A0ABR9RCA7_9FIRM|nr:hypothetical protein [Pseudoflavonifractor gallinarum]MBE5056334.1 hypothetical protein [Pseudoflavonifractor gallinarum]